jgi:squalene synthase HpnC
LKLISGSGQLFEIAGPDGGSFAVNSLDEAYNFTEKLAKSHYENFPVGSLLVSKKDRKYFYAVYAFSRIADDIADEMPEVPEVNRLDALKMLRDFPGHTVVFPANPILAALNDTMQKRKIPPEPLLKLIEAFRRDIMFRRPATIADLEDYCTYSANPIGELVLRITGNYSDEAAPFSDKICTGLQLVNFWQDISRDRAAGRNYIPESISEKYYINLSIGADIPESPELEAMLREIYTITEKYFDDGENLLHFLPDRRIKSEIFFTLSGGRLVLKKTRALGTKIFKKRPKISKFEFAKLFLKTIFINFGNGSNYTGKSG